MTDFPFTVQEYLGPGASPYPIGSTITLRVPGGIVNGITVIAEDGPRVAPGDDTFIFLRNHGTDMGGNTATTIVASLTTDIFVVRSGVVSGQGVLAVFAEPLAKFEQHFK